MDNRLLQGVLDSLTEHIAVINQKGEIITVNEAWRRYGCSNGSPIENGYLGWNYLNICKQSGLDGVKDAKLSYEGISDVLSGKLPRYRLEYPCESKTQTLWFVMNVTPLLSEERFAVISHTNVTERKRREFEIAQEKGQAQAELRKSYLLLQAINEGTTDHIFIKDLEGRYLLINPAGAEFFGQPPEKIIGKIDEDFLPKNFVRQLKVFDQSVITSGETQLHEESYGQDKQIKTFLSKRSPYRDEENHIIGVIGISRDVTEQKALEAELEHMAHHDPLTGLANRWLLEKQFEQAPDEMRETGELALLFLDLDRFKYVNDTLGHPVGDELLVQVAQRLRKVIRGRDILARMGGDEFGALLHEVDAVSAYRVTERIGEMLREPFILQGNRFELNVSIGVAFCDEKEQAFSELLRRADLAMYRAKSQGNGSICYYDTEADKHVQEWSWIERGLRYALQKEELELYYQPIINFSGGISFAEGLLRWNHPQRGIIQPKDFIVVAEDTGLITQLDKWSIKHAIKAAKEENFSVAVNISPRSLQENIVGYIKHQLSETQLDPSYLYIEVTERVLASPDITLPIFQKLTNLGIRLIVDDFGTGYSSLTYLQHYPLYGLKLDRSFVHGLSHYKTEAIAEMIVHLSKQLGLITIAEGVETYKQRKWVKHYGCDLMQGHLAGFPMKLKDFLYCLT